MSAPLAHNGQRPSIMGEAPNLALRILPFFAAALVLTIVFPGRFRFTGRLWGVAMAAGIELAALGLLFWAAAAFSLVRAWKWGSLAKRGAYGLCRHPLHAWWIRSVLPSLALMLDSRLFLVTAPVFWIAARPPRLPRYLKAVDCLAILALCALAVSFAMIQQPAMLAGLRWRAERSARPTSRDRRACG